MLDKNRESLESLCEIMGLAWCSLRRDAGRRCCQVKGGPCGSRRPSPRFERFGDISPRHHLSLQSSPMPSAFSPGRSTARATRRSTLYIHDGPDFGRRAGGFRVCQRGVTVRASQPKLRAHALASRRLKHETCSISLILIPQQSRLQAFYE